MSTQNRRSGYHSRVDVPRPAKSQPELVLILNALPVELPLWVSDKVPSTFSLNSLRFIGIHLVMGIPLVTKCGGDAKEFSNRKDITPDALTYIGQEDLTEFEIAMGHERR
jgi:hypothetical protein